MPTRVPIIAVDQDDDASFINQVRTALGTTAGAMNPEEIYIVKIDKWFDSKWMAFSGKALGLVGVWRNRLTIPPFHPNRVRRQDSFIKSDDGYAPSNKKPLHSKRHGSENLNKWLDALSPSSVFLWYSGATQKLDQASLLVYSVQGKKTDGFYWGLRKGNPGWKVVRELKMENSRRRKRAVRKAVAVRPR